VQVEPETQQQIATIYRNESRRVLATLIRLLGDFELAEEALQEAFAAALKQWPTEGIPANPRAWLVSAGRFKAIDRIRRHSRTSGSSDELEHLVDEEIDLATELDEAHLADDQLRLIFTCCHPALAAEAQIALTLREVCGLTTEEIAAAFLQSTPTVAQRIVRAKNKIRDANIPYQVPERSELAERLDSVLRVLYLVFNEGYSASSGEAVIRHDLCDEALRLGHLLIELIPEPEVLGLQALMLLQASRRAARAGADGELILLPEQDRTLWHRGQIDEGSALVERALRTRRFGPYTLQAAIAAVHAEATVADDTDWVQIVGLYDALLAMEPSPVVALNRAVAVAMRDGAQAGLTLIDQLLSDNHLTDYHLAHAARADFCRQLGHIDDARNAYRRALELARQQPERQFLQRRLQELDDADAS